MADPSNWRDGCYVFVPACRQHSHSFPSLREADYGKHRELVRRPSPIKLFFSAVLLGVATACSRNSLEPAHETLAVAPSFDPQSLEGTATWVVSVLHGEPNLASQNSMLEQDALNRVSRCFSAQIGKKVSWSFTVLGLPLIKGIHWVVLDPTELGIGLGVGPGRFYPPIATQSVWTGASKEAHLEELVVTDEFYRSLSVGAKVTMKAQIKKFDTVSIDLEHISITVP
jgi:hypothetical protein